jgi:hypothetical protein
MTIYHKHHILPKHMGGSDDPSNIKILTIAEHAEEHKKLFEKHGLWQDEVAWKALSGQIGNEEAIRLALSNAASYPRSEETKQKMRKPKTDAHKEKIRLGALSMDPEKRAKISAACHEYNVSRRGKKYGKYKPRTKPNKPRQKKASSEATASF